MFKLEGHLARRFWLVNGPWYPEQRFEQDKERPNLSPPGRYRHTFPSRAFPCVSSSFRKPCNFLNGSTTMTMKRSAWQPAATPKIKLVF